jgi:hypothetical protein
MPLMSAARLAPVAISRKKISVRPGDIDASPKVKAAEAAAAKAQIVAGIGRSRSRRRKPTAV